MTESSEDEIPLTPVAFEILLALADEDRHGYAIMKEVEERTEGAVRIRPGSLYRAVNRMLEQGLIEELEREPEPGEDERRRYYRLTPLGRRTARSEAMRMSKALHAARLKKLLG